MIGIYILAAVVAGAGLSLFLIGLAVRPVAPKTILLAGSGVCLILATALILLPG